MNRDEALKYIQSKKTSGGTGGAPSVNNFVWGSQDPNQQPQLNQNQQNGANARGVNDVVNGFFNGDWARPNNSYIASGSYLQNENIDPRAKAAMASAARQGMDLDRIPSNISQYSGVDSTASNDDLAGNYLYNYMKNMSPEDQSAVLRGIQDRYAAQGQDVDVYGLYNKYAFGDGTGTNGYAAEQAQRNASERSATDQNYQLSNTAQRAQATSQRDQLQREIDDFQESLKRQIRAENPNISDARLDYELSMRLDEELRNPNSDYKAAVGKIKELDGTIGDLGRAIDDEARANEKYAADYKADYVADNYGKQAEDFARDPATAAIARNISNDIARRNGLSEEAAQEYTNNWVESGIVPTDVALGIMEYIEMQNKYRQQMVGQAPALRQDRAQQRGGMLNYYQ